MRCNFHGKFVGTLGVRRFKVIKVISTASGPAVCCCSSSLKSLENGALYVLDEDLHARVREFLALKRCEVCDDVNLPPDVSSFAMVTSFGCPCLC